MSTPEQTSLSSFRAIESLLSSGRAVDGFVLEVAAAHWLLFDRGFQPEELTVAHGRQEEAEAAPDLLVIAVRGRARLVGVVASLGTTPFSEFASAWKLFCEDTAPGLSLPFRALLVRASGQCQKSERITDGLKARGFTLGEDGCLIAPEALS